MNAFIDTLNLWSRPTIDFAGTMLVQSSLLIAVIGVLDLLLRRRVRAQLRYAVWILVLVKLVLPPSLAFPTGPGYWLGRPAPVPTHSTSRTLAVVTQSDPGATFPTVTPVAPVSSTLSLESKLLLGWSLGSVLLFGLLLRRSGQASRLVRNAAPAPAQLQSLLDSCGDQLEVRRTLPLKLADEALSPAVCGLVSPEVILPRRLTDQLQPEQLRSVLIHELLHVKRGDVWVNCAQSLLQMVYWWHPLFWLANARIRRIREEAVDEAVMVALGAGAEAYPLTLLEVAKLALARPLAALGLVGMFESRSALRQRIQRLIEQPVPRSARLDRAGLAAVLICAAVLLPMARGSRTEASSPAPPVETPPEPSVLLDCQFLQVTETALLALQLGPPSLEGVNGQRVWVLPSERFEALRLSEWPGIEFVAGPRIGTASGITGKVSVTRATNHDGRTVHLGTVCELTPRIQGTDVDLTFKVTLNELIARDGDPSNASEVSMMDYVSRELANLRILASDGGAVLALCPARRPAQGPQMMFVIKPTLMHEDNNLAPSPEAIGKPPSPQKPIIATTPSVPVDVEASEIIPRNGTVGPALERRVFKLDPHVFAAVLTNSPSGSGKPFPEALQAFLNVAGLEAREPDPARVIYNERNGMLMVAASSAELDRLASALDTLVKAPQQILIEVRFIEAPEEVLRWIGEGMIPSLPGATNEVRILSPDQARRFLDAATETPGMDVMAAPKVTTLSGRQTQIQQVAIKTVLTGIDPRALVKPGRTAADATNSSPFLSQQVPFGPVLDIIPTVAEDGCSIELVTIPSINEFLGYAKTDSSADRLVYQNGREETVALPLPVFRTRGMAVKARVYDGQTLMLTRPTVSMVTKQADGETRTETVPEDRRKRLIVLVTPTLIDPAGNPIHQPGHLPFDPNTIPQQSK